MTAIATAIALTINIHDYNHAAVLFLADVLAAVWAWQYKEGWADRGVLFDEEDLHLYRPLEANGYIELTYSTDRGWQAFATHEFLESYKRTINGIGGRILIGRELSATEPEGAYQMLQLMA